MNQIRVTEIFYSIQGEAASVGCPTVFIRLTGCPLRCRYCDTAYAFSGGELFTIAQILERVAEYRAAYVTVTGGEPLAQPNSHLLLTQLCDVGYKVSLETSGAISLVGVDSRVIKVMDLKTPSSGELERNLYANLNELNFQDQIKFVIGDRADYQWAKQQLEQYQLNEIVAEVLFSPVYKGKCSPAQLVEWILQDQLPVRFQLQLHKVLWGEMPGR